MFLYFRFIDMIFIVGGVWLMIVFFDIKYDCKLVKFLVIVWVKIGELWDRKVCIDEWCIFLILVRGWICVLFNVVFSFNLIWKILFLLFIVLI